MNHARSCVRVTTAVALLLAVPACAPKAPVEVGVRDYNTDVRYGGDESPSAVPTPAPKRNPVAGFPGFIVPPPSRRPPAPPTTAPTVPPKPTCAKASRLAIPSVVAGNRITKPPQPGLYSFRQSGTTKVGSAAPVVLPAQVERRVDAVRSDDGRFAYDVSFVDAAGTTTTTTYETQAGTGNPELDGLFITRILTTYADGSVDEFRPANGLRLLSLPAQPGHQWRSVATDPLNSTSIMVEARIGEEKARIDACGTIVDAWTVQVEGQILGTDKSVDIVATYSVATQFGGLVLADHVRLTGTDAGDELFHEAVSTVNDPRPRPLPAPQSSPSAAG